MQYINHLFTSKLSCRVVGMGNVCSSTLSVAADGCVVGNGDGTGL